MKMFLIFYLVLKN